MSGEGVWRKAWRCSEDDIAKAKDLRPVMSFYLVLRSSFFNAGSSSSNEKDSNWTRQKTEFYRETDLYLTTSCPSPSQPPSGSGPFPSRTQPTSKESHRYRNQPWSGVFFTKLAQPSKIDTPQALATEMRRVVRHEENHPTHLL